MAWCPICKNEYREGITICADCKEELIEQLQEEADVSSSTDFPEIADTYDVATQLEEAIDTEEDEVPAEPIKRGVYQKKEDKAEDLKSTAFLLFLVGCIGMIALALCFFGVIPLRLNTLTYVVMTGMFLLFIIAGIGSKNSYEKILREVDKENSLTEELIQWCRKELPASLVDQISLSTEEISDEIKYFKRMEAMKKRVNDKFMNLDSDYLDSILDEYYQEIYED